MVGSQLGQHSGTGDELSRPVGPAPERLQTVCMLTLRHPAVRLQLQDVAGCVETPQRSQQLSRGAVQADESGTSSAADAALGCCPVLVGDAPGW